MFRKGLFLGCTVLLVSWLIGPTAWSAAPIPAIHVIADGYYLGFDTTPRVVDGRILVPWRWLATFYGFDVEYNAETRVVTTRGNGHTVVLTVGVRQARVDGQAVALDVPPLIADGRLLVPLRFASEALGLAVRWEESTRTAFLTGGKPPAEPVPPLRVSEPWSARRWEVINIESAQEGEVFRSTVPAEAAVLQRLADGWQKAVPGVHPEIRLPAAGFSGTSVRLDLAGEAASVQIAWRCRTTGCGPNSEGYVYISFTHDGQSRTILVHAPELADAVRTFPMERPVQ